LASEASSSVGEQTSRARNLVLKKRLHDKDRKLADKDQLLEQCRRELDAKMKVIAERDAVVDMTRQELEEREGAVKKLEDRLAEREGMIERLQGQLIGGNAEGTSANDVTRRQL